ncbi:MAG: arginine--tRNA ligase [Bacilli bacterium]
MIYQIKNEIKKNVQNIIQKIYDIEVDVVIERPKTVEMGDIAIPVFTLSKTLKKSPVSIATEIANEINNLKVSKVNVVNGYINLFLEKKYYTKLIIEKVISEENNYGNGIGNDDKTVLVEYSSPNIAKPFHIGHIRTTLIGAALYNVFKKRGYNTVGINHLGDYGTQFGKLIVAIKLWGDEETISKNPIPELLKLYIKFHEKAESDSELDDEARNWFTKLENGNKEAYELWEWIRNISLNEFNRVYEMFGIKFDSYTGESFYSDKMPKILDELREKQIIIEDEGAEIVRLEDYGMPNALITKRDGSTMYITRDLAAADYRHKHYNFYKNIYVVGYQQELHFNQWMKIHELMGNDWVKDCIHIPFGTVSLEEGSLSTRAGRVLFLEDVLNKSIENSKLILHEKKSNIIDFDKVSKQIGIGAIVFQELFINRKKDYSFSWDKTLSFEGETGPYIQYTGVRIKSLLKNYTNDEKLDLHFNDVSVELWNIVVALMNFEEVLDYTIDKYDPSQLAKYVLELAGFFNKYYASNKIFVDDIYQKQLNLIICKTVLIVLEEGSRILGIEIPSEM